MGHGTWRQHAQVAIPVMVTSVITMGMFLLTGKAPEKPVAALPEQQQHTPLFVERDLGNILAPSIVEQDVTFSIPLKPTDQAIRVDASWTPTPCCVAISTSVIPGPAVHANLRLKIAPRRGTFVYRASLRLRGADPSRIDLEAKATFWPSMDWEKEPALPLKIAERATKTFSISTITRHLLPHDRPKITLRPVVKGVILATGIAEKVAEDNKWQTTKVALIVTFLPELVDGRGQAEVVSTIGTEEMGRLPIEWEIEPAITSEPRVLVFRAADESQRTSITSLSRKPFRILRVRPVSGYQIEPWTTDESARISLTITRLPGANRTALLEKVAIETTLGNTEVILYGAKTSEEKKS